MSGATKTLGGDRLGSGKKNKVHMHGYERSNHDNGYIWRSTAAAGTLIPFFCEVALPNDSFKINLNCDVLTHPTIGPLFGSYKVQLDMFKVPFRLYQAQLHNNKLGIGLNMKNVKLPVLQVTADRPSRINTDNDQINSSSILSYLNIRGVGVGEILDLEVMREFNAIPFLGYWDIYKNYYANKQEEEGAVIHNDLEGITTTIDSANYSMEYSDSSAPIVNATMNFVQAGGTIPTQVAWMINETSRMRLICDASAFMEFEADRLLLQMSDYYGNPIVVKGDELFQNWTWNGQELVGTEPYHQYTSYNGYKLLNFFFVDFGIKDSELQEPKIKRFPLINIDRMRENILGAIGSTSAFTINDTTIEPYGLIFKKVNQPGLTQRKKRSLRSGQEGLALKTYQSDLFNNWIDTEWIDGDNGINEITKVDTSSGSFTIDELNLSNKVYNMLNRIAVSGGSYKDWLEVTYDIDNIRLSETPVYLGGLIKELVFQEVISNAGNAEQPLGTLAGRGVLGKKHKGGTIDVRVDEPCYIMGIVSITPRLDYSQGNKWDVNLKTMDDLHKPALDGIGFQDLITDQMAWWDTKVDPANKVTFKSAGKVPAWINYQTNLNQIRGNFAIETQQMFMTLTRRYTPKFEDDGTISIKDLTTYVDPSLFNHIFSYTKRDSQNFWVQIGIDSEVRRKMSAKVIPNL